MMRSTLSTFTKHTMVGFSVALPRSNARSRWWCAVCATGAGERRRTTATPVSPVPAVAPPRRAAAASGRRSCEKQFRLCPALPQDKWPALRSSLPHGLTSALSPGCCASYAPSNADVVPADTPSESPPPNPQAHSIQEQVSIVIAQLGLVKLANRLVQIAGQFRDRLRAHHFAGQGGHYPPHLPRADPAQKCLPDQQRDLLRPPLKRLQTTGQKTLLASTRNPQPDGAEAGHKIPLVVAVAIDSPSATPPFVPPPARIAIALPLRLQLEKPLPG